MLANNDLFDRWLSTHTEEVKALGFVYFAVLITSGEIVASDADPELFRAKLEAMKGVGAELVISHSSELLENCND